MPLHISSLPTPTSDLVVQDCLQSSPRHVAVLPHPQDHALLVPEEQSVRSGHELHRSFVILPDELVSVTHLIEVQLVCVQHLIQDPGRSRYVLLLLAGLELLTQAFDFLLGELEPRAGVSQHYPVVQLEEGGGLELPKFGLLESLFVDLIEHSQVFWKRRTVYSCEDEGGSLQLHLNQQCFTRGQAFCQVFLLDLTDALGRLLPAEDAQPAELALQITDHRIAVLLRGQLQ